MCKNIKMQGYDCFFFGTAGVICSEMNIIYIVINFFVLLICVFDYKYFIILKKIIFE